MKTGPTQWLTARALSLLLGLLARLPEAVAYGAADLVGFLFWALFPGRRRLAREHLGLALGLHPEHLRVRRLARRSAGTLFKVAMDFVRMPRLLDQGRFQARIDVREVAKVLEDSGPGGVLFATGHLGSWEVAAVAIARLRGELHVIGRRMENPHLDRLVREGRERAGLRVHPRRGGIRPMLAALASGKACALLLDQNQRKRPLFLPVFGKLAATDRSGAVLAFRFRAPVLVACAFRVGIGFRFRLAVCPLLWPSEREIEQRDLEGFTRRVMASLESLILAHPEQYLWVHRRYRTRPPEEQAGAPSWCPGTPGSLESPAVHPERRTHGR